MIQKNIFTILTIFIVVSLVIYFFYNSNQNTMVGRPESSEYFVDMASIREKNTNASILLPTTKKKVTFNDNVQYNYYQYPNNNSYTQKSTGYNHRSGAKKKLRKRDKSQQTPYAKEVSYSDSDSVSYQERDSDSGTDTRSNRCNPNDPNCDIDIDSSTDFEEINIDRILSENKPKPVINLETKIIPSNLETNDSGDTWDSSFGLPLMSQRERADYFVKMMDNHKKFDTSMGEFYDYLTDQSTVIKTDTTIDPFKPSIRSGNLKGKAVSDIYDEQVAGPQAKPKKIKFKNEMGTTYMDESEMNGGKISGTNLFGFNGYIEQCKPASFGNEF
jgi:hypothetical protein